MKLEDIFEMPEFFDKEASMLDFKHDLMYSESTIKELFDVVDRKKYGEEEFWVIIKKDRTLAVVGKIGESQNGTTGLLPEGDVEFKKPHDLSWNGDLHIESKMVLQIDGVKVTKTRKSLGSFLYLALVNYGFVIISDTVQFVGGRKLWEKLVKEPTCKVLIIENGKPVMDGDKLLIYDGTNYPAEKIWQPPQQKPEGSTRHTLLVLAKR